MLYPRRRSPSMRQLFSVPLRSKGHLMLYLYSKVYSYQFFLETGKMLDDTYALCRTTYIFTFLFEGHTGFAMHCQFFNDFIN